MAQLFRKILCPVDFDDNSMAALDLACKLAAQNDASLCLIHAVPFPVPALVPGNVGAVPSSFPIWEQEAKVKLEQTGRERIPNTIRYEWAISLSEALRSALCGNRSDQCSLFLHDKAA